MIVSAGEVDYSAAALISLNQVLVVGGSGHYMAWNAGVEVSLKRKVVYE